MTNLLDKKSFIVIKTDLGWKLLHCRLAELAEAMFDDDPHNFRAFKGMTPEEARAAKDDWGPGFVSVPRDGLACIIAADGEHEFPVKAFTDADEAATFLKERD